MHSDYTDEQRAEALRIYQAEGFAAAHRQTGIPKGTLGGWIRKAGIHTVAYEKTAQATRVRHLDFLARRAELRERLLDRVLDLDKRMDQPHEEFRGQQAKSVTYDRAPSDAVKAYALSIGILIDKMRLEMGEPTSRDERSEVSDFDREVRELVEKLRERAGVPSEG